MHSFSNPLVLLTLSVTLSGVEAYVARPRSSTPPLVCYEDNQLRALKRFSSYADEFCPEFLAKSGRYPQWLSHWDKKEVSSACSCYEKTATSYGVPRTAPSTGTLSMSSSAPAALSNVFVTISATGGYLPSRSVSGSVGSIPAMTGLSSVAASPSESASAAVLSTVISASDSVAPTSAVVAPSSTAPAADVPISTTAATSSSSAASSASEAASVASTSTAPAATGSLPAGDNYPPQPPGVGPGKRGLVYDGKTQAGWSNLFVGSHNVTYGSNWAVDRGTLLNESFAYVPTIAVDANLKNSEWNYTVPVLIEGGTKAMFASNEPDNPQQANLTPEQAAAVYTNYMQPYYGTVQLGTPAVTNGGGQTGLTFLENFIGNCTTCAFNFINVHHYLQRSDVNTTQYAQALKDYIDIDVPAVQAKHPQLKGLPIFVGEWWLWGASLAEGGDLMDELLPYLDGNPTVLGYQAFGGLWEGNFINADGTGLTPAGQKYATGN